MLAESMANLHVTLASPVTVHNGCKKPMQNGRIFAGIACHCFQPQSRQNAKLFLESSELGLPQPLTRRRVSPPPGSGGRGVFVPARQATCMGWQDSTGVNYSPHSKTKNLATGLNR